MKILKIVGAVVVVALVVILIAAAFKPADYIVFRETEVSVGPAVVFPHINEPQKTDLWMPWLEMDPATQTTYSGPAGGVGAMSHWQSTGGMGTGHSEVIESVANQKVRTKIVFEKPMAFEQVSEISLLPAGGTTVVRWAVSGHNSYLGRVMCLFTDMEKHVGPMFEKGLAKLKATVEAK